MALQHVNDRNAQPPRSLAGSSVTPQDLQYQEGFSKRSGHYYPASHDQYAGVPDRVNGTKDIRYQGQLKKMAAAYNGSPDQGLKSSRKKKGDIMKLYFSNQQNGNMSGGTESIGDMDTLDSQGKLINNGGPAAPNGGRSSVLAAALGPQILL